MTRVKRTAPRLVLPVLLAFLFFFVKDAPAFYFKKKEHGSLWYAFGTQMLHLGLFHLLANILGFFFFARWVKSDKVLYAIFLFSLSCCAISLCLFAKENIAYVGNSGAIYGIAGFAFLTNRKDLTLFSEVIGMFVLSLLLPGVSVLMHFSGFIAGSCLGVLALWKSKKEQ